MREETKKPDEETEEERERDWESEGTAQTLVVTICPFSRWKS